MPDISTSDIEADFTEFSGVFDSPTITVFGASTGLTLATIPYTSSKDAALQIAGLMAPTDKRVMITTSSIPETIENQITLITMGGIDYTIVASDTSPETALTILTLREPGMYP